VLSIGVINFQNAIHNRNYGLPIIHSTALPTNIVYLNVH
jgi:hypothetical protein